MTRTSFRHEKYTRALEGCRSHNMLLLDGGRETPVPAEHTEFHHKPDQIAFISQVLKYLLRTHYEECEVFSRAQTPAAPARRPLLGGAAARCGMAFALSSQHSPDDPGVASRQSLHLWRSRVKLLRTNVSRQRGPAHHSPSRSSAHELPCSVCACCTVASSSSTPGRFSPG